MGGEYEYLHLGELRLVPQTAQHIPTVEPGETDIEYDDVWVGSVDLFESRRSVDRSRDIDVERSETHLDQPSDRRRVLDD